MFPRISYWYTLLRRTVWPVVAFTIAVFGALFSLRDEFLSADIAGKLKMPAWLPAWPWYVWTIIALIIVIIALLEGSYQEHLHMADFSDEKQSKVNSMITLTLDARRVLWGIITGDIGVNELKPDMISKLGGFVEPAQNWDPAKFIEWKRPYIERWFKSNPLWGQCS